MAPVQRDFQIVIQTPVAGISIIRSYNEEAFNFLTDELEYGSLPNGDVSMASDDIEAFIMEAENAHFYAECV